MQKLIDDDMRVETVRSDQLIADTESMLSSGVTEGDFVYLLGFPMALVGDHRAAVIVRSGSIARVQDLFAGVGRSFLVDASVFPGNSGADRWFSGRRSQALEVRLQTAPQS